MRGGEIARYKMALKNNYISGAGIAFNPTGEIVISSYSLSLVLIHNSTHTYQHFSTQAQQPFQMF